MKASNLKLIIFVLYLICSACSPAQSGQTGMDKSEYSVGQAAPPPLVNVATTPIVVSPANYNISTNQTIKLSVTGGIPPYKFILQSGQGNLSYLTGVFTSFGNPSTVLIKVADSTGASTPVTVLVAGGASTTSSTSSTTNCSNMLSTPGVAIMDTSVNSDGSQNGLGYGTAVNLNDATSCGNWCGSVGAAYCMWSNGGGISAAVCVGWPSGVSVTSYAVASGWTVYSGTCQ